MGIPLLAEQLAEHAYNAYGDSADWRNYQGFPMPQWSELPTETRMHWVVATQKVKDIVLTERGL